MNGMLGRLTLDTPPARLLLHGAHWVLGFGVWVKAKVRVRVSDWVHPSLMVIAKVDSVCLENVLGCRQKVSFGILIFIPYLLLSFQLPFDFLLNLQP